MQKDTDLHVTLKNEFAYALQAAEKQSTSPVFEPPQQETSNEEEQSQARAAAKRAKKLRQKAKKKDLQSLAPSSLPNTPMPKESKTSVDAQTSARVPNSFPETLRTSCCLREFFSLVISFSKKSKAGATDHLSNMPTANLPFCLILIHESFKIQVHFGCILVMYLANAH